MNRPVLVASAAALASTIFGASGVVAIRAVVQDISPLNLAVIRFLPGAVFFLLCLLVFAPRLLRVRRADLPLLVLLGALFYTIFPLLVNTGLQFTEVARAAIMQATLPLWSVGLARTFSGERLRPRQFAGILLAFFGVTLVLAERGLNWQTGLGGLVGDGLLLLTGLLGAIYGVLARRLLARSSPITVTAYAMLIGSLLLGLVGGNGLLESVTHLEGRTAMAVAFMVVLGGALPYFLWTVALARVTPTQVAVFSNVNPVVAAVLGAALLGEALNLIFGLGMILVLAGLLLVNLPPRWRPYRRVAPVVPAEAAPG